MEAGIAVSSTPSSNSAEQESATAAAAAAQAAAIAAAEKDKKDLEVIELLVPGVMDDLVESTDLDEEVRKFFY
ncbi:GH15345 [Drosophila grimshawi]|uniref:GH15345 n=1 Tax=Drosophila grimshawi TaxID=7222 RepID=B4J3J8_DROGR|nr:GH15345 [Drosophila grimshawi]